MADTEASKKLVRRFYLEMENEGRFDVADEVATLPSAVASASSARQAFCSLGALCPSAGDIDRLTI